MIFVTVGTQLPFPRLLEAVCAVARQEQVIAQTLSRTRWGDMENLERLSAEDFQQHCAAARCIVSHAGIGTFLAARAMKKPLIVMPRRAHLGEHRSDHQMDTCRAMAGRPGVQVVEDGPSLADALRVASVPFSPNAMSYDGLLSELRSMVA